MIRGGGDHDAAWAAAARASLREKGVEDAEAVIKAARRVAGLGASQTCIYGRSAGGYTVGALVNRHPTGILFGAVYTEAPFVDVLNTMSNPALPASLAESGEFGHPERIEDLETMLRLSPVQNVPATVQGLFIICRTALGDIEVAAYEPVKWITRLGTGLLYVKNGAGHFTETDDAFQDMAEDFCLLQAWLN
jgi:oligopeptidase B